MHTTVSLCRCFFSLGFRKTRTTAAALYNRNSRDPYLPRKKKNLSPPSPKKNIERNTKTSVCFPRATPQTTYTPRHLFSSYIIFPPPLSPSRFSFPHPLHFHAALSLSPLPPTPRRQQHPLLWNYRFPSLGIIASLSKERQRRENEEAPISGRFPRSSFVLYGIREREGRVERSSPRLFRAALRQ